MALKKKISKRKALFGIALFILLVSRILVLTNNYNWPVPAVLLELAYMAFVLCLVILRKRKKLVLVKGSYIGVVSLLLIHTLLWGLVFVNREFSDLITENFKPQIMFVVLLAFNVMVVKQLHAEINYLKCSYYALACVLTWSLLTNLSQVDLSNLANIMSATERTRANFGFGHYNTLGAACTCVFVLRDMLKKTDRDVIQKVMDYPILVVAFCMLLCSASRSALTSLVLYFVVYHGMSVDDWNISNAAKKCIKLFEVLFILLMGIWVIFEVDMSAVLVLAQRALLFTYTLPMFFASGRVMLGLGYASNAAYGADATPYRTLWLDNAYAYYLITTGVLGFLIVMVALLLLAKGLLKNRNRNFGRESLAMFCVYLYISCFEAVAFNSGVLVNYMYLPWLILAAEKKRPNSRIRRQ